MALVAEAVKGTLALVLFVAAAPAAPLDEMALPRWARLREVERYQLNVAEKYYRDKQWKIAKVEYEKYVQLYEKSEAASYAQMKWALCQVELRNLNTAIKDGFKTVIDYWPDSPEAVASAYFIARGHRDTGDVKEAKKAYAKLLSDHPKHVAAVQARADLMEIARKENDTDRQVALLRDLTFSVERDRDTAPGCAAAARQLTVYYFETGDFAEGLKALATNVKEEELPIYLLHYQHGRLPYVLGDLAGRKDELPKRQAAKLADDAVAWFKAKVPTATDEAATKRGRQLLYAVAEIERAAIRPDRQRETLEQIAKTYGADDELLGRMADWHLAGKRPEEARRLYARYKNVAEGLRLTAVSYRAERRFDPAIETYRRLAAQDAKKAGAWLADAAMTYREAAKPDQAVGLYREIIALDPGLASDCQWQIGLTYYHFGRWKEAIGIFRATDRFPQSHQHMAHAHRQLKQYGEAITLYRQIAAAHPPLAPWAILEIAYTQEEAGQKEVAIKAFKAVCDRFPKSGEASRAHALLQDKYKINVTLGGAKDE
jgi:tetratricopeptide (TPR) repeat protein